MYNFKTEDFLDQNELTRSFEKIKYKLIHSSCSPTSCQDFYLQLHEFGEKINLYTEQNKTSLDVLFSKYPKQDQKLATSASDIDIIYTQEQNHQTRLDNLAGEIVKIQDLKMKYFSN
jgi:hypothetical protein